MKKRILMAVLVLPSILSANFFWVVVMQKDTSLREQIILSNEKFDNLREEIRKGWHTGYAVTDVSHSPRRWSVVMSRGSSVEVQTMMHRRILHEFTDTVTYYEKHGYVLENVENGVGEWVAIFKNATGEEKSRLIVTQTLESMQKHIIFYESKWFVKDIEPAEGSWIAVMGKDDSRVHRQYLRFVQTWEEAEKEIAKAWKRRYNIKSLEYGNNMWILLFERYDLFRKETYVSTTKHERLRSSIRTYWQQGYKVTDLAEGRR